MTDKEMAEEYANNHVHYEVAKRENGAEYAKKVSSVTIKQAYSDGLKDGRPKWHKVADGNYPPCDKGNYSINVLADYGDIVYYNYDEDCWVVEPLSTEIDPPIAWCEIPKYKDVEE